MRFVRQSVQRKLLMASVFLAIMLSTSYVFASNSDKRLNIFFAGGGSFPVSDFSNIAKSGFNWGAGAELRFPSNWAMGIVVHGTEFEHQRVVYNSWLRSWRSIDWTFVRGNWYGKYLIRKKGISPFFKTGIGIYSLKGKNTFAGRNQTISETTGYSIVPGVGVEYSTKRALLFAEIDYNFVLRESTGGCVISTEVSQFFDLFLGVAFFLSNL